MVIIWQDRILPFELFTLLKVCCYCLWLLAAVANFVFFFCFAFVFCCCYFFFFAPCNSHLLRFDGAKLSLSFFAFLFHLVFFLFCAIDFTIAFAISLSDSSIFTTGICDVFYSEMFSFQSIYTFFFSVSLSLIHLMFALFHSMKSRRETNKTKTNKPKKTI